VGLGSAPSVEVSPVSWLSRLGLYKGRSGGPGYLVQILADLPECKFKIYNMPKKRQHEGRELGNNDVKMKMSHL